MFVIFAQCITHTTRTHPRPSPDAASGGVGSAQKSTCPSPAERGWPRAPPPPGAPPFLLHSLGHWAQDTRGPSPCSRSMSGCVAPHFPVPQPSAPGLPADAGRCAHGAVGGGGRGGHRSRAEALAGIHEAGRRGRSFGEGRGRQAAEVRCGAWWEGGRGEGGKRRQARGAAPRGGGHRAPMLLRAHAVEDLACVQRRRVTPPPRGRSWFS